MADKKVIAQYFLADGFNTGNLAPADEWVAPNFVNHDPATPPLPPGPSGFKQLVTTYRTAFPDIQLTIDDLVVEGDKVAGRWTARGTNKGTLMGMPPTGKSATVTGISILTFANDQVTVQQTNWDAMGLLQQLGVIPTPG